MGKKNKHNQAVLMREWPEDESETVSYGELIYPLKHILSQGYKMERNSLVQFVYKGYNIGKEERELYYPTPQERFSSRWLENENKMKRSLLDNVLVTVFQFGVEYGRRTSNVGRSSTDLLEKIIESRTATIAKLRAKLSNYDLSQDHQPPPLTTENQDLLIDSSLDPDESQNDGVEA